MDKQQAYQSVRDHLNQWQQALAQVDEIHAKHGVAGKPAPGHTYSPIRPARRRRSRGGNPQGGEPRLAQVGGNCKRLWSAGTAWC